MVFWPSGNSSPLSPCLEWSPDIFYLSTGPVLWQLLWSLISSDSSSAHSGHRTVPSESKNLGASHLQTFQLLHRFFLSSISLCVIFHTSQTWLIRKEPLWVPGRLQLIYRHIWGAVLISRRQERRVQTCTNSRGQCIIVERMSRILHRTLQGIRSILYVQSSPWHALMLVMMQYFCPLVTRLSGCKSSLVSRKRGAQMSTCSDLISSKHFVSTYRELPWVLLDKHLVWSLVCLVPVAENTCKLK